MKNKLIEMNKNSPKLNLNNQSFQIKPLHNILNDHISQNTQHLNNFFTKFNKKF